MEEASKMLWNMKLVVTCFAAFLFIASTFRGNKFSYSDEYHTKHAG